MTAAELIQRPDCPADDADAAAWADALPERAVPTPLTIAGLADRLAPTLGAGAIDLGDRLLTDAAGIAANKPTIGAMLEQFKGGGTIDFGNPLIRAVVGQLAEAPGDFSAEDAASVLSVALLPVPGVAEFAAARAEAAKAALAASANEWYSRQVQRVAAYCEPTRQEYAAQIAAWNGIGTPPPVPADVVIGGA